MSEIFKSFDEFYNYINKEPIEALERISCGRKNKVVVGKHTYKLLEKKLNQGNTLKEFYELVSIDVETDIIYFLITCLTFKDQIDEAKGVYPIKEGAWNVVGALDTYFKLDSENPNFTETPKLIAEKFFKIYANINKEFKKDIVLSYNNSEYKGNIVCNEKNQIMLYWGNELTQMLLDTFPHLYPKDSSNPEFSENYIFTYEPRCRMIWDRNYEKVGIYFYIDNFYMKTRNIEVEEVEVPRIIVDNFFWVEKYLENKKETSLTLIERDNKHNCYIRKVEENYLFKFDEKLVGLLNEKSADDKFMIHFQRELNTIYIEYVGNQDNCLNKEDNANVDEDDFNYQVAIMDTIPTFTPKKPQKIPKQSNSEKVKRWDRNPKIALESIINAQFRCELDKKHITFISLKTGENFVEAHHIIPMSLQSKFKHSLDVPGNIVSLCPNCHRAIHHSTLKIKEGMLKKLYEYKSKELECFGISISFEQLLKEYI